MNSTWVSPRSPPTTTLKYSVAGCSEHSGRYIAANILVDNPTDQASRWSGAHPSPITRQWILLRLERTSVLNTVTFGKFHKPHPCNMKEFKLYSGMTEEHMTEVLHSGLKNDTLPETFSVKHHNSAQVCFPTRFVKIVPLSAHGQSFHTSIWYFEMAGITDESHLEQVQIVYDQYRETATMRQALKYLRQRRLLTPYRAILARSGLRLEHPLITDLHRDLVLLGDWAATEQTLQRLSIEGLFDTYLRACQPQAIWTRLHVVDADGDAPSKRGGHAMCINHDQGLIYLLGGWDGQKSLDDFWVYDIKSERWRVLSHSTSKEKNGPGARACHKMVYDSKTGCIYLLGRLSDGDSVKPISEGPVPAAQQSDSTGTSLPSGQSTEDAGGSTNTTAFCSEFYRYHTRGLDAGEWDLLSFDTTTAGGPPLVFDHQMVMDSGTQILYVFGGRIVDGDWDTIKCSGLYSYNVRLSKWRMLQSSDPASASQTHIPPRFGHSMVLEPYSRTLFIFAGQRDNKYLSDMFAYDISTNSATELYSNFSTAGGPDACFTQRAVIDANLKELYVFCGLTRSQQVGSETILQSEAPNWVYGYDTRPGTWTRILPEREGVSGRVVEEPLPRYAHQVVYDPNTKMVFLHGGNAGIGGSGMERSERGSGSTGGGTDGDDDEGAGPSRVREGGSGDAKDAEQARRLDDFWCMKLKRPAAAEVIRRATYQIRRQQFREMCEEEPPVKALNFLQSQVSSVVDHSNQAEAESFRTLLSHLLARPPAAPSHSRSQSFNSTQRKRTRADSPVELWTSKLDEDEIMAEFTSPMENRSPVLSVSAQSLRAEEDPEEAKSRNDETKATSGEWFEQRTEVFEVLLEYIADKDKQPSEDLLDLVDLDKGL